MNYETIGSLCFSLPLPHGERTKTIVVYKFHYELLAYVSSSSVTTRLMRNEVRGGMSRSRILFCQRQSRLYMF